MLPRNIASTSVCFRCRLRLLLSSQKPRHLSTLSATPSLKRRQPIPSLRHFATESTAPAYGPEHSQQEKEEGKEGEDREDQEDQEKREEREEPQEREEREEREEEEEQKEQNHSESQVQPQEDDILFSELSHYHFKNKNKSRGPPDEPRATSQARGFINIKINRGGKKRRVGNRLLTEATESLAINMLGKPAHAIVMKEDIYQKKGPGTGILDEEELTPTDIEALLDSQREAITPEEVRANIDELRPATETFLPEKEFRKLQNSLAQGFLLTQLRDYVEDYKKHGEPKSNASATSAEISGEGKGKGNEDDGATQPYEWIKSISPWTPLNDDSTLVERAYRNLHGYLPKSHTEKERLAVRILRECWQLSIPEFNFRLGETRITVRTYEFTLLMRGTQRFMNQLGVTWLDPGEKIEAFQDQKLLRLITTKPKAEVVLKDIHETLMRVTTQTVPLTVISSKFIDDAMLEEVGRITNTHVRKSHNQKREDSQLHVTWIEPKRRDGLCLEDLRHVVMRLLWTAFTPERASTALYAEIPTDETSGQFIVDKTNKEKWSWKDKMEAWARYVFPLATPKLKASSQDTNSNVKIGEVDGPLQKLPLPVLSNLRGSDENQDFVFENPSSPENRIRWSKNVKTTTKAHFGHLLHSYQQPALPPQHIPELLASHHPRIFSPTTPHPLHLAKLDSTTGNSPEPPSSPIDQTKSTIVIRFRPSPNPCPGREAKMPKLANPPKPWRERLLRNNKWREWPNDDDNVETSSAAPAKKAEEAAVGPVLELRLAATDTEILGVESLQAIIDTHISDVMLPSSPVDMRVTQTQHVDLMPPSISPESITLAHRYRNNNDDDDDTLTIANWLPIADFLSNARLELAAGKLEMPPRQRFPIPRRLFFRDALLAQQEEWRSNPFAKGYIDYAQENKDMLSTNYEFVGLELHRSASIPYDGRHMLTYTSIEAGQGGGRRAEVTLEPVSESKGDDEILVEHNANVDVDARGQQEEEAQKDFLSCCYGFAKSDFLWSGYLVNQQRKP